jgi:hypothetical protein
VKMSEVAFNFVNIYLKVKYSCKEIPSISEIKNK